MKLNKKIIPLAVASSLSLPAMMLATPASADVSANVAVSNMYLWRGQNLAQTGGTVSGGVDYSHESGFYAGVWTSSETGGSETDLYFGFGGDVSGVGYDVGYTEYAYPEDDPTSTMNSTDASEVHLNLSYSMVSFSSNFVTDNDYNKDAYYSLSGEFGPLTATVGKWDLGSGNKSSWGGDAYSHLTLDYAATDELTFSLSVAQADKKNAVNEHPLFAVSYAKSFDL
jgi:uncharacterized protein (TIGR02001 family)